MSLILEALRKSEAERRRGETPSVYTDLPAASTAVQPRLPATAAWWMGAGVALIVVLLGARMLLDRQSTATPRLAPAPVVRHRPVAALPPVPHLTPSAPPAPEIAATPPPPKRKPVAPAASPPVAMPAPTPPPVLAAPRDDTMRLSDLDPEQRKALPPLKLSMHMWNDDPSRRFVILDGNRLREGDRIGDAVVTAIVADGVVLDWNGRKLKLPIR